MIALNACKSALTVLNAREWLGCAEQLLNLPPSSRWLDADNFFDSTNRILSPIVGNDIVRALRRKHQPEQLYTMTFGYRLEMNTLSMLLFSLAPRQLANVLVWFCRIGIIIIKTVAFDRAIESFPAFSICLKRAVTPYHESINTVVKLRFL